MRKAEILLNIPGNQKILTCNIDKKAFTERKAITPEVKIEVYCRIKKDLIQNLG